MTKGWRGESSRHSLARYGIKTANPKSIKELKLKSNRLPVQIGIIVPSTNFDKKISKKEYNKRVLNEKTYFSELFGGNTAITEKGGYIATGDEKKDKILIEEEGTIVEANTTSEIYKKNKSKVANHIKKKQKDWKQETIGYSVEGNFYVYPKKSFIGSDKAKNIILE